MDKKDLLFIKTSKSKFRSRFHLNSKMKEYVELKGIDKIKNDAYDIINSRIKPKDPKNDGKQTPMKQVHPVFIAQHACACCCRGCIEKWHKIPRDKELTNTEVDYIVSILIEWIKRECVKEEKCIQK